MNAMEDLLVGKNSECLREEWLTASSSSIENDPTTTTEQLRKRICGGRGFDYSDHIVLYFAQILPIALMEVLHSTIVQPFWGSSCNPWIPLLLWMGLLYLYLINAIGALKTAIYFHTPLEVVVGYVISLLYQIPLCLLQCRKPISQNLDCFQPQRQQQQQQQEDTAE